MAQLARLAIERKREVCSSVIEPALEAGHIGIAEATDARESLQCADGVRKGTVIVKCSPRSTARSSLDN